MYVRFDIDIFSIILLIVVLGNNIKNSRLNQIRQKLFRSVIVCDMFVLFMDIMLQLLEGTPGAAAHVFYTIFYCIFFVLGSLSCLLWAMLCSAHNRRRQNKLHIYILGIPFVFMIASLLVNYNTGWIFSITESNIYIKGPWYAIASLYTYPYMIYSIVRTVKNKRTLSKNEYYPYILAPVLPAVAGAVQYAFNIEIIVVWPIAAITLLILQLYSLDEEMSLDHMTGLYNRKSLDDYVEDIIQMCRASLNSKNKKKFAALMFDIDNFKAINDTYGHVEGDNAIKAAANILNNSVRKGDFVSRYGGDEFLIILNQCTANTPRRVITRVEENTHNYNEEHSMPYTLKFSVGFQVFSDVMGMSSKDIFSSIDELMYKNKQSKVVTTETIEYF